MSGGLAPASIAAPPHSIGETTRHYRALDSLRGVAASAVVLDHCALFWSNHLGYTLEETPVVRALEHLGHAAVIVFFVLSGFVLQLSFQSARNFSYFGYVIKRLCRVYPALLVAVTLSATLLAVVAPEPRIVMGTWLNAFTTVSPDPETVLRTVLLLCISGSDIALDPPVWSLAYEMRFSLLFPLMAWCCARRPRRFLIGMVLLYACVTLFARGVHIGPPYILGFGKVRTVTLTLMYLPVFGAGMVAAWWLSRRARPPRLPIPVEIVATVAAVIAGLFLYNEALLTLAALALIGAAVAGSLTSRALLRPVPLFLGRISYSLYIVHLIVLFYTAYALVGRVPVVVILAVAVVASVALASGCYMVVERPGMALGRHLAGRALRTGARP
jgi:peptidoglycan/LPS O-acetylase OafA/YrhL